MVSVQRMPQRLIPLSTRSRSAWSGSAQWPLTIAILAVSLLPSGATAKPEGKSIQGRLLALEDRTEIEELILGKYSHAIDTSDVAALSELFTQDGEYSSEWKDLSSMPPPLRRVFTEAKIPALGEKSYFKVTFRGRRTIANFMSLVAKARATFVLHGDTAEAVFDAATSGVSTIGNLSDSEGKQLPGQPDAHGPVPMKHLVTNPRIIVSGNLANATSYWTEISSDSNGKTIVAGGGYYTDVLARAGSSWRIRRRTIHNFDER